MYKNIGRKIKGLAKFICWIGITISVIWAIYLFSYDTDYYYNNIKIITGIIILIAGPIISWIGSFFAYGFGELIEKTTEIADNVLGQNNYNNKKEDVALKAPQSVSKDVWICPECCRELTTDTLKCKCGYTKTE